MPPPTGQISSPPEKKVIFMRREKFAVFREILAAPSPSMRGGGSTSPSIKDLYENHVSHVLQESNF